MKVKENESVHVYEKAKENESDHVYEEMVLTGNESESDHKIVGRPNLHQ